MFEIVHVDKFVSSANVDDVIVPRLLKFPESTWQSSPSSSEFTKLFMITSPSYNLSGHLLYTHFLLYEWEVCKISSFVKFWYKNVCTHATCGGQILIEKFEKNGGTEFSCYKIIVGPRNNRSQIMRQETHKHVQCVYVCEII